MVITIMKLSMYLKVNIQNDHPVICSNRVK